MGQRLVVTVNVKGEDIAKLYYHWSAYSISALAQTRDILNCLLDNDNEIEDLRLRLIRFVESEGGCIRGGGDSREFAAIQAMYPNEVFKTEGSRNDGLIALTEEGMDDLEGWSEGSVTIYLDDGIVWNSVFDMETIDEFNEWRGEDNSIEYFPELDIDLEEIPFDKLDEVIDALDNLNVFAFRHNDMIFSLYA